MRTRHGFRSWRGHRKVLSLLALAALVVAACGDDESTASSGGSGGSDGGGGEETLQFGLLTPYSGSAASYGPPEEASVRLAIQRINEEGGIKAGDTTYMLELKTYDSAYDPTQAVTGVRKAVDQDGIKFLEVLGGGIVPAVQPITEAKGVLIFAVAAGNSFMSDEFPMTFRPYYDTVQSGEALLEEIKSSLDTDSPRVVLLFPDDDLGHELADEAVPSAEEIGYEVTSTFLGRDVTDFAPVLTNILAAKPDVIDFGPTPQSQVAALIKQARQLGYEGTFIFPDTIPLDLVNETAGKGSVEGSLTAPYWGSLQTEHGKFWAENVGSIEGGDPNQVWTVQPYDNLFLLKAAIERAGTIETKAVAKALMEISIEGALGTVAYDAERKLDIEYPMGRLTSEGTIELVE